METSILSNLPYQTPDTNILTIQVYILFKIDRKNSLLRFLRTKKESITQNQPQTNCKHHQLFSGIILPQNIQHIFWGSHIT